MNAKHIIFLCCFGSFTQGMNRSMSLIRQAAHPVQRQLCQPESRLFLLAKKFSTGPSDDSLKHPHPLMNRDIQLIFWGLAEGSRMPESELRLLAAAHYPHLTNWQCPDTKKPLLKEAIWKSDREVAHQIFFKKYTQQEVKAAQTQRERDEIHAKNQSVFNAQQDFFEATEAADRKKIAVKQARKNLKRAKQQLAELKQQLKLKK